MHNFADTVLWIYIVLLLVGGLIGFLKAKSKVSLITSGVFAAVLVLTQTGIFDPRVARNLVNVLLAVLLVVFAIRTRRPFFRSRPHGFLVAMALGSVAVAIVLPLLAVGRWFGFVPFPPLFLVYLIAATAAYLALVEITKTLFYRRFAVG